MKVKLVFEKSYSELRGLSANTFSKDIELELPSGIELAHLVSARCYAPERVGKDNDHFVPNEDVIATIWDYTDEQRLVGKLLTYIDATYTDKEQREAHKDLVKDLVYGYCSELRTRAHQTIESQSKK